MRIGLLIIMFCSALLALEVVELEERRMSILSSCDMATTGEDKGLEALKVEFKPLLIDHLNMGVIHKEIWLHCQVHNPHPYPLKRFFYFSSPLLEHITMIYQNKRIKKGVLSPLEDRGQTLVYTFPVVFLADGLDEFYFKVETIYTPLDFSLFLEEPTTMIERDHAHQLLNAFLLGMVFVLMLYAFFISFYIKDRSYLFYAIYLFALIYQQLTYLGMTQLYFPYDFVVWDAQMTLLKISFLIISSALFAISFLKTHEIVWIHRGYWGIILLSLVEVLLLDAKAEYSLYVMIFTGTLFILYNLLAGLLVYRQGRKEARLFIAGFLLVFFSYGLMIIDALGIASVMLYFRNLLLFTTAIEALILSLAFADRYMILQEEKAKADRLILEESRGRERIIQQKVVAKTKALNQALKEKDLLMQEIHHRVKNNLQVILSMIRLQRDGIADEVVQESLLTLEYRINAIAKSYANLITKDRLDQVDMQRYLAVLLEDLEAIYRQNSKEIRLLQRVALTLPFKQAVYVGLIVNELVSNAFKHAFKSRRVGRVAVYLYKEESQHILEVRDNGVGFDAQAQEGLGLMLIKALVEGELNGRMDQRRTDQTIVTIYF